MRLSNHHDARNTLRVKPVERHLHNFGVCPLCCGNHHGSNALNVGEGPAVASRQLADDMSTECFQFFDLLDFGWGIPPPDSSAGACSAVTSLTFRRILAGRAVTRGRLAAMARRARLSPEPTLVGSGKNNTP